MIFRGVRPWAGPPQFGETVVFRWYNSAPRASARNSFKKNERRERQRGWPLPCEGRCEHPGSTMPRANYSITVCLIFLGLALLVRTVAIAQRACDVLLPPTSCDYWGHAIAPIAIGYTGGPAASSLEPTAAIYARPVVNIPVTNPPSVEIRRQLRSQRTLRKVWPREQVINLSARLLRKRNRKE